MTKENKEKLLKYLYPNERVREFMCNDLYVELINIIPMTKCICFNNTVEAVRQKNYKLVEGEIKQFLSNNLMYLQMLKSLNIERNIEDIIIGLVFFISCTQEKYKNVDIFKNKKSICYNPMSLIDLL